MVNPTQIRARNDLIAAANSGNIDEIKRAAEAARRSKQTLPPSALAGSHGSATAARIPETRAQLDLWRAVSVHQPGDSNGIQRIDRAVAQDAKIYNLDNDGNTFLLQVIMDGNCDDLNKTIDHLVSHYHLNIHAANHFGHTALMLAAFTGKTSTVRHLIKHYHVAIDATDNTNDTALHWAAYQGQEDAGLCLIDLGVNTRMINNRGETPLKANERHGHNRLSNKLLACETQSLAHPIASSSTESGATSTTSRHTSAVSEPVEPWMTAVRGNDTTTLQQLMDNNRFHIRMKDSHGNTGLHEASAAGHTKMIYFLMGHRADIHAQNNLGQTALHLAAIHGHVEVIEALVLQEAEILAVDNAGLTIFDIIKARPDYHHNDRWQNLAQYLAGISGYTGSTTPSPEAIAVPPSSADIPSPQASNQVGHDANELVGSSPSYLTSPEESNILTRMQQHQPISSAPAATLFNSSTSSRPSVTLPHSTQPSASPKATIEDDSAPLCCTIVGAGELMEDPVINSVGQTYERKYIENWYAQSDRDPNTGVRVTDKNLIPNIALRAVITGQKEKQETMPPAGPR